MGPSLCLYDQLRDIGFIANIKSCNCRDNHILMEFSKSLNEFGKPNWTFSCPEILHRLNKIQQCLVTTVIDFSALCWQTGTPARFDFQGHLLPPDADIPVHQGLHHHGDEPEVTEHLHSRHVHHINNAICFSSQNMVITFFIML